MTVAGDLPPPVDPLSMVRATFACRCPRCGKGPLFSGLLAINPACSVCGQSFGGADVGDAFAVPILMVLGAFVVGSALWVDVHFAPPWWVHALIWPPVTIGGALLMTRYLKSFFAVQQYRVRRSEMES